jgi:hypothetical protein
VRSLPAAQCTTTGTEPVAMQSNRPRMRPAIHVGSAPYRSIIASNIPRQ